MAVIYDNDRIRFVGKDAPVSTLQSSKRAADVKPCADCIDAFRSAWTDGKGSLITGHVNCLQSLFAEKR